MGGHSDSEGRRSHSKKKRSQSRSPKRHKKHFRRHSRSNSRSPVRRRSRSLSNNQKKYHSKSKSPARYRSKSRSKSPIRRRSRSKSPNRRRSRSKSSTRRRSRSRSPTRRRSRSKSSSRRRSRTKSPVKHHSRSKSPIKGSKSKEKQMKQGREKTGRKKENKVNKDPDINLTGFEDLLPVEQAKIRMKLALSAAVSSDIPSKDQKNEDKVVHKKSLLEQMDRTRAIEAINNPEFFQQSFKSKQEDKDCEKKDLHSEAMFGEAKVEPLEVKINPQKLTQVYSDCLAHPNLFEDIAEKEERWRKKLSAMRQSKLDEGKLF